MSALVALGGAGGVVVFLTAIVVVGRGIFKMVNATEENTKAMQALTGRVESLFQLVTNHETRIAVLEDRIRR